MPAVGAIIGVAQWLALRARRRVSPWWIVATAVSLPLAGWLFFTASLRLAKGERGDLALVVPILAIGAVMTVYSPSKEAGYASFAVAAALAGIVYAATTTFGLAALLRSDSDAQNAPNVPDA